MALPKKELRITVPTGGWDIALSENGIGVGTATIAAGDYYLTSATALLSTIKTQLEATGAGTYTVSLNDDTDAATGKVTISVTGVTNYSITWTDTALRDLLGFTGNITTQTTATGSNHATHLWLPPVYPGANFPMFSATTDNWGQIERDVTQAISPAGNVATLYYNTRYRGVLTWNFVSANKAWKVHETTTNESFEKFMETWETEVTPIRYYSDRSDDSVYQTIVWTNPHEWTPQEVDGWVGASSIWTFPFEWRKSV